MDSQLIRSTGDSFGVNNRIKQYCILGLGLIILYPIIRGSQWLGSAQLHTVMEVAAAITALVVGALALTRFYSQKASVFLIIGAGFLGAFLLDGYHAVVTSAFFAPYLPSDLPSLIPWSWLASRLCLAVMLFLSWTVWRAEREANSAQPFNVKKIYAFSMLLTIASFIFFAFVPLPRAYYPEFIFHRPEEFVPALFFAAALAGYLHKGAWRSSIFEHWLVLALIVSLAAQMFFMSFSGRIFDVEFDVAHLLKVVSYSCVLTGLIADNYQAFRKVEEQHERLLVEVDARLRSEDGAAVSASRSRLILNAVIDGIITINDKGIVEGMNPAAEQMFGYQAEQVIGQNISMLMPTEFTHNHDAQVANCQGEGVSAVLGARRDLMGKRRDGSTFPIEIAVTQSRHGGNRLFFGVIRDITEQMKTEAERERVKLELIEFGENAERAAAELERSNADLEQFASIAAHDLQEPLRKVQAFGDRLKSRYVDILDEQGIGYINRMQGAADRMQQLITDLLAFSRVGRSEQQFVPVDLAHVASSVVSDLEIRVNETGAKLAIASLPTIDADPLQMRQLFQNLIGNALKYQRDDITPEVFVDYRLLSVGNRGQTVCELTVTDNGIGFDDEYAERIFGIFQRLHGRSKYDGTGVGLAICRKITERHGGSISARGLSGQGATFVVLLPISQVSQGVKAA